MNPKQLILIGGGGVTLAGGAIGAHLLMGDKTIEDRLKSQGKTIIEGDNQYQIAFKELKNKDGFLKEIGDPSNSDNLKGGQALEKWCKENLPKPLSKENVDKLLEKTKEYCTKPPLTISEKIERKGKKLINNWKAKFEKIKPEKNGLQEDLIAMDGSIADINDLKQENKAVIALEGWCEAKGKLSLLEEEADTIWDKVEKRCLQEQV